LKYAVKLSKMQSRKQTEDREIVIVSRLRLWERLCRLVGFEPVGKRVMTSVDDTADPNLYDYYDRPTTGIIHSTVEERLVFRLEESGASDLCAIIELDSPLSASGGDVHWLLAVPRHEGYGLHSLCLTFIAVNVFFIEGPNPPPGLTWESMGAICSMKLIR
jgi:hypothetical protein